MSKVLFISHSRSCHGAEMVFLEAMRVCVAHGAEVLFLTPGILPDEGLDERVDKIGGVMHRRLPYRAAGGSLWRTLSVMAYNLYAVWRICWWIRKEGIDCVYSNTSITILGAQVNALSKVRHVWHFHEPVDARYGWNARLAGLYRRWMNAPHTKLVFISHQQETEWEASLQCSIKHKQVVYNPIKLLPVVPRSAHEGVRIGFLGHFEERKNIDALIRAFTVLHQQDTTLSLWLCGATNEQEIQMMYQKSSLRTPALTVQMQTAEVEQFYASIDILVLPSWRETMPLVAVEAMQAGVCVVQTNQSGLTELLQDGRDCLFFSPYEPNGLVDALRQCLIPSVRERLAKNGCNTIRKGDFLENFRKQIYRVLCE